MTVHTERKPWVGDIVRAWNRIDSAVREYERTHPQCRISEGEALEEAFAELAQLLKDALPDKD